MMNFIANYGMNDLFFVVKTFNNSLAMPRSRFLDITIVKIVERDLIFIH